MLASEIDNPMADQRLVLAHGFTQTARCWGEFGAELANDATTIRADLPGHGRSGHARASLDETARLIGELGGRAMYLGYSMGGRVALHLALQRPDLVQGLVLIGATAGIADAIERQARRDADEELAQRIEDIGIERFIDEWLDGPLFSGLDHQAARRTERLTNTAAGLAASLRSCGTGSQAPLWDRLTGLEMPTLVMAGDSDTKFTAIGRRLVKEIGPNASFQAVRGASHAAHLELPAESAAIVRDWRTTR